jgi:hypothetical protein
MSAPAKREQKFYPIEPGHGEDAFPCREENTSTRRKKTLAQSLNAAKPQPKLGKDADLRLVCTSTMKDSALLALLTILIVGCKPGSNPVVSATSGPGLDEITPWLKIDYYPKNPKSPAYLTNQPSVIPIALLAGIFSKNGADIDVTKATYHYCNLSPSEWTVLRALSPTVYPVAWSPIADASGRREVATVDLSTDVFQIAIFTERELNDRLVQMEAAIRKGTGREDFSLRMRQPQ